MLFPLIGLLLCSETWRKSLTVPFNDSAGKYKFLCNHGYLGNIHHPFHPKLDLQQYEKERYDIILLTVEFYEFLRSADPDLESIEMSFSLKCPEATS